MKSLVISQNAESFYQQHVFNHNSPSGILNSKYKAIVQYNFEALKKTSLFSIKQRIKSKQYNTGYAVVGALKVAIFVVGLLIAFN